MLMIPSLQRVLGVVAILNASRMLHHGQHQSEYIHDDVPLAGREPVCPCRSPTPPFIPQFPPTGCQ
jgi:hypothetical protein